MKTRQLVILAAVVAALLVIYGIQRLRQNAARADAITAKALLPDDFDPAQIASIVIRQDGETLTMELKDGGWTIRERYGYPVDRQALQRFFMELCDTQIAQVLVLDDAQKAELQLDEHAVTVTLRDAGGRELWTLAFGQKHETKPSGDEPPNPYMMMMGGGAQPTGRFLRLADGQAVTVANTFDCVDNKATDWLDKEFLRFIPLSMTLKGLDGEVLWVLSREQPNQSMALEGDGAPDGQELDASLVNGLSGFFNWTRFKDIADPNASPDLTAMVKCHTLIARDADGLEYQLAFGQPLDDSQFLRVQVAWNGQTARPAVADESPEDKEKADAAFAATVAANQKKAAELNARLSPWTFEVDASWLNRIPLDRNKFFKEKALAETKE